MKYKMINQARQEFELIKASNWPMNKKLNELVELRNYLRETYQMSHNKRIKYVYMQGAITKLIDEIDACWWSLFTTGEMA